MKISCIFNGVYVQPETEAEYDALMLLMDSVKVDPRRDPIIPAEPSFGGVTGPLVSTEPTRVTTEQIEKRFLLNQKVGGPRHRADAIAEDLTAKESVTLEQMGQGLVDKVECRFGTGGSPGDQKLRVEDTFGLESVQPSPQ